MLKKIFEKLKIGFEKLKNKYSVIYMIITLVLSLLIGVAMMWTGLPVEYYQPREDDLVGTMQLNSSTVTHSATVDDAGNVVLDGIDCYFEVNNIAHSAKTVVLRLAEPVTEITSFRVSVNYGDGYVDERMDELRGELNDVELQMTQETDEAELENLEDRQIELVEGINDLEGERIVTSVFRGADCVCINIPSEQYTDLRIRPDGNLHVAAVEFHSQDPILITVPYPKTNLRVLCGLVGGFALWLIFILLEMLTGVAKKIADLFSRNKKLLLQDVLAVVIIGVGAVLINLVVSQGAYPFTYPLFVALVMATIYVVVRNVIILELPLERTVFAVTILMGLAMILCTPFGSYSWDVAIHYVNTLRNSGLHGSIGTTTSDISFFESSNIALDTFRNTLNYFNENGKYVVSSTDADLAINYLPSGVAIAVARLLHFNYFWRYNIGRIVQLVTYALCGYFGIKRLHSGKMIFTTIFFYPVSIFLASHYSYDYWVTGFIMLGMAYFVGICQEQEESVKYSDTIIMCLAMAIGCMPKKIYVPVLLFPLLIATRKIKDKKWIYYGICIAALVLVFATFFMESTSQISNGGDVRGGSAVNPSEQLAGMIANPIGYAGILINFMIGYLNPSVTKVGTFFAYFHTGVGYTLIVLILAIVTLTDKDECDRGAYPVLARLYSVPFFFGEIALMATALYMAFTPVGSLEINGCQGRYMIPLLYPLCSILCGGGIRIKKNWKKWYNSAILALLIAIIYINTYYLMVVNTLY
ncbi:MAG: DUF2142 domain-containing protein [Lachnospiraceae bacterium]|nr:DUF2142 domain-containing protein [Lachnospiraceae bacterium]